MRACLHRVFFVIYTVALCSVGGLAVTFALAPSREVYTCIIASLLLVSITTGISVLFVPDLVRSAREGVRAAARGCTC